MEKAFVNFTWRNEPRLDTPINETNLNKINNGLNTVDNRVIVLDTSKANQSDLLQTIKTVTYNTETGLFTFTYWNGNIVTVDLNIEKIPVSFSMSSNGEQVEMKDAKVSMDVDKIEFTPDQIEGSSEQE